MFSFKINKKKAITNVVVCVRRKDFLLLWRHLQIWSPELSCSIKTFDYGIVFFSEMVVRVYNPHGVKKFQIAQFQLVWNNCFAPWFTLISKGWNLLIRLYGMITNSQLLFALTLHKKWSFPLRISSVNVTKSAGDCGLGYIYWTHP